MDKNIKFTLKKAQVPSLDCVLHVKKGGDLDTKVNRKPTHTDLYLLFDSHHQLEHKLGNISILQHWTEMVTTNTKSKDKECRHLRSALKVCCNADWVAANSSHS